MTQAVSKREQIQVVRSVPPDAYKQLSRIGEVLPVNLCCLLQGALGGITGPTRRPSLPEWYWAPGSPPPQGVKGFDTSGDGQVDAW